MGCGKFIVKHNNILFFANLFFALAGLALLGISIAVQLKVSDVIDVFESENILSVAPVLTIIVGSVVFVIAFFGCCGAIRENNCMLVTYAIFMIILMVTNIVLATFIFLNLNSFLDDLPSLLSRSFTTNPTSFQAIESTFSCCGIMGATSYLPFPLSDTCCAYPPCIILNSFAGCNYRVHEFVSTFSFTIGIGVICIGAVELVAAYSLWSLSQGKESAILIS